MPAIFQRPSVDFSRRLNKAESFTPKRHHAATVRFAESAKNAIASTAFQRHKFTETKNEIEQIQTAVIQKQKDMMIRKPQENSSSTSSSFQIIDEFAKTTHFIAKVRQEEILKLARQAVDEQKKLNHLISALDKIGSRFTSSSSSTPDTFCYLVSECSLYFVKKEQNETAIKLFDRYRELMTPHQQIKFGFDRLVVMMKKNDEKNGDLEQQQQQQQQEAKQNENEEGKSKIKKREVEYIRAYSSFRDFIQPLSMKQRSMYSYPIMKKLLLDSSSSSSSSESSWMTALQLLSQDILMTNKEIKVHPRVAVSVVDLYTKKIMMKSDDENGLDGLRRIIDQLCENNNQLVSNIDFWNSYLRGLSSSSSSSSSHSEELHQKHVQELIETNMPHYGVQPNLETVEVIVTANGLVKDANDFVQKMIKKSYVTKDQIRSSEKIMKKIMMKSDF